MSVVMDDVKPKKAPRIFTLTSWQSDTLNTERWGEHGENRIMVSGDEGNLWASLNTEGAHTPVLDIDFPARLIPSATPGHFHLYLDGLSIPWEKFEALLIALAEAGVISKKYLAHSLKRKMTMVRKEGVPKIFFDHHFSSADPDVEPAADVI